MLDTEVSLENEIDRKEGNYNDQVYDLEQTFKTKDEALKAWA
jgi:hypothetical protein